MTRLLPLVALLGALQCNMGCANNAETAQNPPQTSNQEQDQQTAGQTNQQTYHVINNESNSQDKDVSSEDVEITSPDGSATKVAKAGGSVNVQIFSAPATSGDTTPGNAGTQTPSASTTGTSSATQDITATLQLLLQLQAALQANQTPNQGQGSGTATNTTTNDQKIDELILLIREQAGQNAAVLDRLNRMLENDRNENSTETSNNRS